MATMQALVIGVERNRLLVLDFSTRRRVIVNTPSARGSTGAISSAFDITG